MQEIGDNPGEGTTLNVFAQRSLVDAALLAQAIGEKNDAAKFRQAAAELATAINTVLWDEASGGYFSGYFTDADLKEMDTYKGGFGAGAAKSVRSLMRGDNRTAPTLHSNLFALDRGVVPPERQARVLANVLAQSAALKGGAVMVYHYLAQQLYALDRPESDQRVLALWRDNWGPMVDYPAQCSWEGLGEKPKSTVAHIYGLFPGAHLSRSVLGVRRDEPVAAKQIVIEPHLGDLTQAEGTVVTEFGLVPVSWQRVGENLEFNVTVPPGVTARLRLPAVTGATKIELNGKSVQATLAAGRLEVTLSAGSYTGRVGTAFRRNVSLLN